MSTSETRANRLSEVVRRHWAALLVVVMALGLGLWLRLWMLGSFPQIFDDTYLYGNIAHNILHGSYALSDNDGVLHGTLVRLPGYPLFLAACFKVFGVTDFHDAGQYLPIQWLQIALDLAGVVLLSDFVRRWSGSTRAAVFTLVVAALCPFTAIYASAPLAECATLFLIALGLWSLERLVEDPAGHTTWRHALLFTIAITGAALLRPDGALVGVVLVPAFLMSRWRALGAAAERERREVGRAFLWKALVCALIAALPFVAWTWRNWERFHVFEPLAPRYATDPGEPTYPGFQLWTKTWCLDFVSTYQVYWNFPDGEIHVGDLPERAFDSPEQRAETEELLTDYNKVHDLSPELDAKFEKLARERIEAAPLRFYLWMPAGRVADMWLRPRVENLPIDLDWWVYGHHRVETRISWALAGWNALYILMGIGGLLMRPRFGLAMLGYFVLRSLMLATVEAPEARYTLECFPMLFVLGGYFVSRLKFFRPAISG